MFRRWKWRGIEGVEDKLRTVSSRSRQSTKPVTESQAACGTV